MHGCGFCAATSPNAISDEISKLPYTIKALQRSETFFSAS
jgi:hypothetical protein